MNPATNWFMQENFYPDVVVRLRELLIGKFVPHHFKAVFDGNPDPIGKSFLPCICITETKLDFDVSATGTDDNTHNILIRICYNKRDDYGASLVDSNVDLTERKLRLIVMGRDPNTMQYLPNTLLGVLRPNFTLGNYVIGNRGGVTWGVMEKEDANGIATAEAHIALTVTEKQIIPVRT